MRALLRLKTYLRPHLRLIAASMVLALPLAALRVSPAPLVQKLIDELLANRDEGKLLLFPALFIAVYSVNFVVRFLHYYFVRIVVARVNQKIKGDLFGHVMGLSADFFASSSTGALMSRVGSDPQAIDGGISAIQVVVREPVTFLLLLGYALHLNWKLTLITLAILPGLAWVFSVTGRNLRRYIRRMQEENATLFTVLQESYTGARVIKAFGLEPYVARRFGESNERFTKLLLKTAVLEEAAHPMVELLTSFAIAGVIYVGGGQVIRGELTPGELMAFFAAFALMMNPLRLINEVNMKLAAASAASVRIEEVFSWRSRVAEAPRPRGVASLDRAIELDGVRFAYPDSPEREILRGVSFAIPKGSMVALVGASGAGKSSLASLLPRIFDVTGGAIRWDGTDLRELSLAELRARIAVVSQDVFLFDDTIAENIRLGRAGATDAEVREAARRAHALEFIERLPNGMATRIGERGQKLSGGERQRVSIARAFLREAPVLVLDEATSSLDSASERAVQEALDDLMRERTTLVIAHRLSTVRGASQILVLRDGEVVERGTHDQLIEKRGEYARFHAEPAGGAP